MSAAISAAIGGAALMALTFRTQGYRLNNGSPQTEYNKALVRRLYTEVWGSKDKQQMAKAVLALVGEEHILVDPSSPTPMDGVLAYQEMVEEFRSTFPNFKIKIDMLVAEGPRVTALLTFSSGDLPNNARSAVWTATSIMEFAGGQVVKTWVNSDALSALTQLGLVPDMASGPFKRQTPKEAVATYLAKVASSTGMVDALLGRREEHPTEVLTHDEWIDYFLEQAENASTMSASQVQFMQDKISGLDLAC